MEAMTCQDQQLIHQGHSILFTTYSLLVQLLLGCHWTLATKVLGNLEKSGGVDLEVSGDGR